MVLNWIKFPETFNVNDSNKAKRRFILEIFIFFSSSNLSERVEYIYWTTYIFFIEIYSNYINEWANYTLAALTGNKKNK